MNYFIIGCPTRLNSMKTKKKELGAFNSIQASGSKELGTLDTPYVTNMLSNVPKDLYDLFIPKTEEDLTQLEMNLATFSKFQEDRARVRVLQLKFGLSFRPNMSLEDTIIRVKIKILKDGISKRSVNPLHRDLGDDELR